MKNMFLLFVVPVLLVTQGFGQAYTPSSNTNPASIKGCISVSDSNYTIVEDGTAQTFKITSSTVDLKAHVGHDVEVTGQKANAAASSGSSDNSVVITGVNMISEQCAATSTATTGNPTVAGPPPAVAASIPAVADPTPVATADSPTVTDGTPVATASTSAVADPTPAATADAPAVTDSTPTATAGTPPVTDQTPTATASTAAVADPTPAATDSAPMVARASAPEGANRLPDTATSLPLLGLLGLGLLATGLLSRKSRTN
jgi:hypothetical protein